MERVKGRSDEVGLGAGWLAGGKVPRIRRVGRHESRGLAQQHVVACSWHPLAHLKSTAGAAVSCLAGGGGQLPAGHPGI